MVAIRATTGPARNSLTSAGVSLRFFPIHSGVCLSVISPSFVRVPVSLSWRARGPASRIASSARGAKGSDISQRRQGSIVRLRIALRVDRLDADVIGARFQMRAEAAGDRRRIAGEHHRVEESVRPAASEFGLRETEPQPVVAIVGERHVAVHLSPGDCARGGRVRLEAHFLLDHEQLSWPQGVPRHAGLLGRHVIGNGARRTLRGEFQHQRPQRRDHNGLIPGVRRFFIEAIEIAAHGRDGLLIDMTAHPLDHRRVADAEAKDEAIVIEAGQGAQAPSGGEGVAGVDIRNRAPDDDSGRVGQHEAGDGEGFVSEGFRVPEGRVAEILDRSHEAFDPRSVQPVDRIPDAQFSQRPHRASSAMRRFGRRSSSPVDCIRRQDATSWAYAIIRLQSDADPCRTASKVISMGESSDSALSVWLEQAPLAELTEAAGRLRDEGHGRHVSYSRKVFIPLTHLCRDVCHYCTFAERPRKGAPAYLTPDDVLAIARAGAAAGCTEALFTLGDKPELRYRAARDALSARGYETTIGYLEAMCALVLRETGL